MPPNATAQAARPRPMLDRIGNRWTTLVVLVLLDGPRRFGELRDRIGGVARRRSPRRRDDSSLTASSRAPPTRRSHPRWSTSSRRSVAHSTEPIRAIATRDEHNVATITRARRAYDGLAAAPAGAAPASSMTGAYGPRSSDLSGLLDDRHARGREHDARQLTGETGIATSSAASLACSPC